MSGSGRGSGGVCSRHLMSQAPLQVSLGEKDVCIDELEQGSEQNLLLIEVLKAWRRRVMHGVEWCWYAGSD